MIHIKGDGLVRRRWWESSAVRSFKGTVQVGRFAQFPSPPDATEFVARELWFEMPPEAMDPAYGFEVGIFCGGAPYNHFPLAAVETPGRRFVVELLVKPWMIVTFAFHAAGTKELPAHLTALKVTWHLDGILTGPKWWCPRRLAARLGRG